MGTIELKSNLHKIVDRIEDEQLLRAIYSFLEKRENSEDGRMWKRLTDEQKKEFFRLMKIPRMMQISLTTKTFGTNFK